jgi:hypothetical protein
MINKGTKMFHLTDKNNNFYDKILYCSDKIVQLKQIETNKYFVNIKKFCILTKTKIKSLQLNVH